MSPKPRSVSKLARLHKRLCFQCAFPNSVAEYRRARAELRAFEARVAALPRSSRDELWDTGIAGTPLHYGFSFEVARWLASRAPGTVTIDWESVDETSRLDELLAHLLHAAEDEYFYSGAIASREWIDLARTASGTTDFDWLMAQLRDARLRSMWSQLYDAADLQLAWDLCGSKFSKSRNSLPVRDVHPRGNGMRKRPALVKKEIQRSIASIHRVSARDGSRLLDVAMASLAVRHRETYHFNHANPREVYLADVGEGVAIAVFGLRHEYRFALECTMGFLILSNGMPIGYGGSSVLFRQANTGINIFDEYRGSEAAFLWVQVMRVYHHLVGCTRFIANPYQFGAENDEALKSGAFWFYYRLGFRPTLAPVRKLAQREAARRRTDDAYRSDIKTLRKLASADMHLTLPAARARDAFDERWLETSSLLAIRTLSAAGGRTRKESADRLARNVARDLSIRSLDDWSSAERRGFERLAPIVAAVEPATWSREEKRAMRALLRAKGGTSEAQFARLLEGHAKFLKSLQKACRQADRE